MRLRPRCRTPSTRPISVRNSPPPITNYASNIGPGTPTEILDAIGGKPIKGKPGLYQGGMDQGAAFNYLNSNLHSPGEIEPLVDPNNPNWRAAAAGYRRRPGFEKRGVQRP